MERGDLEQARRDIAEARASLKACLAALAAAREMLGVMEDHGGHDGLGGKGYRAALDQIDESVERARAALLTE